MNDAQRVKRLEKASLRVLFSVPFFAPGVCRLADVLDDNVTKTAGTDGKSIYWNREFLDKLKDEELVTVKCHEVTHNLLGHGWRAPAGVDWETWNEATDHAVNNMLKEFSEQVTGKRLADPFPFPDGHYCCNPAFKGMAEEVIYGMLSGRKPPGGQGGQQGQPGQGGNQPGQGQGQGNQPGKGKGKGQGQGQGQGNQPGGPGNGPGTGRKPFGEVLKPKAADAPKLKQDWEHVFIQSVQAAKGRGDIPAGVAIHVGELLNPKVPWTEILRALLRETCADDYSYQKPNPFFDGADFIMPSMESDRAGAVVFATDTSGSTCDPKLLADFRTQKQWALDDLRPSSLLDIYCDAAIQLVREYHPGETVGDESPGGGGTDFRPVFAHCADLPTVPKALVYLTDLDGQFPKEDPGYPVIWVTWEKEATAPFGEVVRVAS